MVEDARIVLLTGAATLALLAVLSEYALVLITTIAGASTNLKAESMREFFMARLVFEPSVVVFLMSSERSLVVHRNGIDASIESINLGCVYRQHPANGQSIAATC